MNPLLRWREANGKSLADVAAVVHRSRSLVDRWEKGIVETASGWRLWIPPTVVFWRLRRADILGVAFTFDDWLSWLDSTPTTLPGQSIIGETPP